MVTWMLLIAVTVIVLAMHFWGVQRGIRRGAAEAYATTHDILETAIEQTEAMRLQWERLERELADEKFRHESRVRTIEGILHEKEVWRARGEQEAIAHGNAQAMMMGVIEHLHRRLAQEGIDVPLPLVLKQLQEEFVENHVKPVIDDTGNTPASTNAPVAVLPDTMSTERTQSTISQPGKIA